MNDQGQTMRKRSCNIGGMGMWHLRPGYVRKRPQYWKRLSTMESSVLVCGDGTIEKACIIFYFGLVCTRSLIKMAPRMDKHAKSSSKLDSPSVYSLHDAWMASPEGSRHKG